MEMPVKMKGYPWTAIIFLLVAWNLGDRSGSVLEVVPGSFSNIRGFVFDSYKDPNISQTKPQLAAIPSRDFGPKD